MTDLIFVRNASPVVGGPVELIFGATGGPAIPPVQVEGGGQISGLFGSAQVRAGVRASGGGQISGLFGSAQARWDANVSRSTRAELVTAWQEAKPMASGLAVAWQEAAPARAAVAAAWQEAEALRGGVLAAWQEAERLRAGVAAAWEEACGLRAGAAVAWQEAERLRGAVGIRWQEAAPLRGALAAHWQETERLRAAVVSRWQEAARMRAALRTGHGDALAVRVALQTVWQEAKRPPAGVSGVVVPVTPPCYKPGPPVELVFRGDRVAGLPINLIFRCGGGALPPGAGVIVPVRKVYVTVNTITLRRVDGNVPLQAESFGMSIDVDSWTWNWSASMPASARQYLAPVDGLPVVLEATVNGVPYRLCAESMSRSRTHGSARINVQGRGLGAVLDAPYAPTLTFGNTSTRTAQQLAADVLTINGVSMGWAVDWGLADWQVPGGIWTHQGSYISAINAIAAAAGGYVQPHATAQTLRILRRYPAMPWAWGSVTPDYELPADVVEVEGVEWVNKPAYNWVHVAGVAGGVQVEATRAGTAGDVGAPGVVDSLITHLDAARQRAAAVLADTGPQAAVSLKLPVLASTGVIQPGKFVRYLDGAVTRVGIVRGTALDWQRPTLRQTLTVETHGTD